MKLSDFEIKEFYNYKIRSVVEDNVEMFFVTDLVNQYNKINGTCKKLKHYLNLQRTREILAVYQKMAIDKNFDNSQNKDNLKNIPGIIKHTSFSDGINVSLFRGYLMCEDLLHDCLLWLDIEFAIKVLEFLRKCRHEDNQFLDNQDEFLRSRAVLPTESQDWSFMIMPVFKSNEVILKASYCRTKNITKTQFMNSNAIMLHGLPNGFSFKYFVFTELLTTIKSYGGHSNGCHRSSYSISRHVFENNFNIIIQGIVYAINKTRHMLNWGLDYESEVCTQVLNKLKSLEIPFCTNINMSKDSLELIQKLFSTELLN